MKKLIATTAIAVCAALALPGVASAGNTNDKGWTNYAGKTKEGTEISFAFRKGWISLLDSRVPSTCASGQGGTPRVRISLFDPPDSVAFKANGRESQTKVTEPWPERYYTVTARKQGKRIVGKLRLSWSFLVPNSVGGYSSFICVGTGNFNVKPVK